MPATSSTASALRSIPSGAAHAAAVRVHAADRPGGDRAHSRRRHRQHRGHVGQHRALRRHAVRHAHRCALRRHRQSASSRAAGLAVLPTVEDAMFTSLDGRSTELTEHGRRGAIRDSDDRVDAARRRRLLRFLGRRRQSASRLRNGEQRVRSAVRQHDRRVRCAARLHGRRARRVSRRRRDCARRRTGAASRSARHCFGRVRFEPHRRRHVRLARALRFRAQQLVVQRRASLADAEPRVPRYRQQSCSRIRSCSATWRPSAST